MDYSHEAPPLAYLVILGGCLLAFVTAFEPQATGAWHLAGAWLFCGLIPYLVYGSLTTLLDNCTVIASGLVLLIADLIARAGLGFSATANPDPLAPVWLSGVLVLATLPAGVLAGKLFGRLAFCTARIHTSGAPD